LQFHISHESVSGSTEEVQLMLMTGWPFWAWDFGGSRLGEEVSRRLGRQAPSEAGVFPAVNIYDDGEGFLVRAEMPGIDKNALEVTARGDQLAIRGERVLETAEAPASYHRREREGGQFRRTITLPQKIDSNGVRATYTNGVLEVVLPRLPEAQPRKVQIS
jgi:HSP20 family protein